MASDIPASDSPRLEDLLGDLGYRDWWHCPPMYSPVYSPDNFAGNPRNELPRIASFNLRALPADRRAEIGLRPVTGPDVWPVSLALMTAAPG